LKWIDLTVPEINSLVEALSLATRRMIRYGAMTCTQPRLRRNVISLRCAREGRDNTNLSRGEGFGEDSRGL
jgi:hypothetical protein